MQIVQISSIWILVNYPSKKIENKMIKLYDKLASIKNNSPWILLILFVYTTAFVYLFVQNFIFSESVNLLNFRSVDDLAFQQYLRGIHKNFRFLQLDGYAYGWIFWFPLVILTYPFYFLSIYCGIDIPLIVITRQLSLFLVFGTAFNLFKIVSIYTKDNFLKFIILLLFLSFPTTGYFAITFGTASQVMFFSSLTFYFAVRKPILTKRDLFLIAISMSATAATKLSGLLILPAIGLVIADRFFWKVSKENLINAAFFILVFFGGLVILSQVRISVFLGQIEKTQTNYGNQTILQDLVLNGIVYKTLNTTIFIIMFFGILIKYLKQRKESDIFYREDFIYILFTVVLSIVYLVATIKMGTTYIVIYFTTISFFLTLGVLPLEYLTKKVKYISGISLVIFNIVFNWHHIVSDGRANNYISWNSYYKKSQDKEIKKQLFVQKFLQQKIGSPSQYKDGLNIIREKQLPLIYSSLNEGVSSDIIVYNNFEEIINRTWLPKAYDIIGIYKNGIAFMKEEEFIKLTKFADKKIALQYEKHRNLVKEFVKSKSLNGSRYDILFEDDVNIYFNKIEETL